MKQENKSKVKKMEEWHEEDGEKKRKWNLKKKKMGNLNAQRRRRERKQEKP